MWAKIRRKRQIQPNQDWMLGSVWIGCQKLVCEAEENWFWIRVKVQTNIERAYFPIPLFSYVFISFYIHSQSYSSHIFPSVFQKHLPGWLFSIPVRLLGVGLLLGFCQHGE